MIFFTVFMQVKNIDTFRRWICKSWGSLGKRSKVKYRPTSVILSLCLCLTFTKYCAKYSAVWINYNIYYIISFPFHSFYPMSDPSQYYFYIFLVQVHTETHKFFIISARLLGWTARKITFASHCMVLFASYRLRVLTGTSE